MSILPIKLKQREVGPHKSMSDPLFDSRTVLTNSPWTFTALWLKRNGQHKALFYWEQAQEFHNVSVGLSLRSAPLLLYYCFMNAAKALLVSKGVIFNERHGVSAIPILEGKRTFLKEGVKIYDAGILPSLSQYYGEAETEKTHSLKDLLANMVFIHRTYCLTFVSHKEMYVPLANCGFVYESRSKEVFFKADIEKNIPTAQVFKCLPSTFRSASELGPRAIRSNASLNWKKPGKPTPANVAELSDFNRVLRQEMPFINGAQTLWYLRLKRGKQQVINRQLPTMILAVMHRLSELCRYQPLQLDAFLSGDKNWLLSEFIGMSAVQYIDEIASEITGHQFLVPNVRAPA